MPRLRPKLSLGLMLLLLAWAVPRPAVAQGAGTVDARQLLAIARGGLTAAAGAAQGPLNPAAVKNRPFWAAVDAMGRSLDAVQSTFLARDPAFFGALSTGSRNLAELKAVWAHSTPPVVDAPAVASGLETLSAAYLLLRGSYGWEALRRQQGGGLTADEARRLTAMQQAQAALAQKLTTVRTQAKRAGDRQAAADLSRLIAQARALAAAEQTLAAYLAALQAVEAIQGQWAGDSHYVKPAVRKAWKKASPVVEDLTTDSGVGFVFTTDLSKVDGWAPLDQPVEVPAGVDLGPEVALAQTADPSGAAPGDAETAPQLLPDASETPDGEEAESAPEVLPGDDTAANAAPKTGDDAKAAPQPAAPPQEGKEAPAPPTPTPAPAPAPPAPPPPAPTPPPMR